MAIINKSAICVVVSTKPICEYLGVGYQVIYGLLSSLGIKSVGPNGDPEGTGYYSVDDISLRLIVQPTMRSASRDRIMKLRQFIIENYPDAVIDWDSHSIIEVPAAIPIPIKHVQEPTDSRGWTIEPSLGGVINTSSIISLVHDGLVNIKDVPVYLEKSIKIGRAMYKIQMCVVQDVDELTHLGYASFYKNSIKFEISHNDWIETLLHEIYHVMHWQHNTLKSLEDSEAAAELAVSYALTVSGGEVTEFMNLVVKHRNDLASKGLIVL